ncbi:MAG: GntR family transcriptional regulator [Lentisphaeria bacterium]|nr:GntR family transcriptional regulator [Lentisphaeria bacterium]
MHIDPTQAVPVFQQLVDQVVAGISRGALRAGDAIPSVREMARTVRVNANTVAKAYRDLERLGLVETRKGLGLYVVEGARERCRSLCRERVVAGLDTALAAVRDAGLTEVEARELVDRVFRRGGGS